MDFRQMKIYRREEGFAEGTLPDPFQIVNADQFIIFQREPVFFHESTDQAEGEVITGGKNHRMFPRLHKLQSEFISGKLSQVARNHRRDAHFHRFERASVGFCTETETFQPFHAHPVAAGCQQNFRTVPPFFQQREKRRLKFTAYRMKRSRFNRADMNFDRGNTCLMQFLLQFIRNGGFQQQTGNAFQVSAMARILLRAVHLVFQHAFHYVILRVAVGKAVRHDEVEHVLGSKSLDVFALARALFQLIRDGRGLFALLQDNVEGLRRGFRQVYI